MKIDDVEDRARALFTPHLAAMTVREAIALMVRFYEQERVDGVDIADDGDMLLAQWGPYGEDEGRLIFDIVRQLIAADVQDAEPTQLHLRCTLDAALDDVEADDLWCDSPADVPSFLGDLLGQDIIARATGRYEWTIVFEEM